jgi:MoaA/NifB/PqqE/SkfB family radical SAM enzyme
MQCVEKIHEYKKIFMNFKRLLWVTITGGEPFLRDDLKDIVVSLYDTASPRLLTIATNGLQTKKAVKDLEHITRRCPHMKIFVNLSLDGVGEAHDKIRGVSGGFKKLIKTAEALDAIQACNLFVGINTVVSKYNATEIPKIYEFVERDIRPDSHIFELAERRAKLYNLGQDVSPSSKICKNAISFIISRVKESRCDSFYSYLIRTLRLGYYDSLLTGRSPIGFEGIASAYIMPTGDVWLSYSERKVAGNLRDSNYDFSSIWFSDMARTIRSKMRKNYNTTLVNAFYVNALCNFAYLPRIFFSIPERR